MKGFYYIHAVVKAFPIYGSDEPQRWAQVSQGITALEGNEAPVVQRPMCNTIGENEHENETLQFDRDDTRSW